MHVHNQYELLHSNEDKQNMPVYSGIAGENQVAKYEH